MERILLEVRKAIAFKGKVLIGIDGMAGAGKSTLARELAEVLNGEIIPMDDFFLPPELRTAERLAEAGGNVHYERFSAEVGQNLVFGNSFDYGVFDCSKMAIDSIRHIENGQVVIVEGSYCLRPEFRDLYDVRIFMEVDEDIQMKRITERNGSEMALRFKELWIPMENKYFKECGVKECADIVLRR